MRKNERHPWGDRCGVIARLLPGLWLGLLIGVSFLATPVKFQAPGLELAVALEVGHVTFRVFSRVEWVLAMALSLAVIGAWLPGWQRTASLLLLVLVALQGLWLLPALDVRVLQIVTGSVPEPSVHHHAYAVVEATKALLLAALAIAQAIPPRSVAPDGRSG